MRIGIIAEGRGDLAVLTNILKGALGIDQADVQYIRPEFHLDETDLAVMQEEQFSSWTLVKQECRELARVIEFLEVPLDEERLLVIHLDTAEMENTGYEAVRPADSNPVKIRESVIAKIKEWMNGYDTTNIRFAVAVEETDAWLLTLYIRQGDTCSYKTPKERLQKELNKALSSREIRKLSGMGTFDRYWELSKDFRKAKKLRECAGKNHSLRLFYESLIVTGDAADAAGA